MVHPPSLFLSLFFIYNISFYSLPPVFNISQMHRLQTDIAPTQNKTRSSEKKKKKKNTDWNGITHSSARTYRLYVSLDF